MTLRKYMCILMMMMMMMMILCRCVQNCQRQVDRRRSLVLRAYCSANSSDVGRPCSGSVHWELAVLSVASSDAAKDLPQRQDWTEYADGGSTLMATSHALPSTASYVTFEVKASGESPLYL